MHQTVTYFISSVLTVSSLHLVYKVSDLSPVKCKYPTVVVMVGGSSAGGFAASVAPLRWEASFWGHDATNDDPCLWEESVVKFAHIAYS